MTIEDKWAVFQTLYDGHPLFVRVNLAYAEKMPSSKIKISFAAPMIEFTDAGLPTSKESTALNEIEDMLTAELEPAAHFVLVLTTNAMREWVFYAGATKEGQRAFDKLRKKAHPHELQFIVEDDPDWLTYKMFSGVGG